MGLLQKGKWVDRWYDTKSTDGHFIRKESQFRNWITKDGSVGKTGKGGFKAENNRYHLYVSYACPWAHRTLIFRSLKGLEKIISLSIVNWFMGKNGWTFEEGDGVIPDRLNKTKFLYQIYTIADPDYSGRVTVPILWDKKTTQIVSNESSEIIRMMNSAFDHITKNENDFFPKNLRENIENLNKDIYRDINNGVYKAGFATTSEAYNQAVKSLFQCLEQVESRLQINRFLLGGTLTEADWRLFTTLVRFDPVYVGHFKCNLKRVVDYPAISGYLRELYQMPGISKTVIMDHIKLHYYGSHKIINPRGIIPKGPILNYDQPHNRDAKLTF